MSLDLLSVQDQIITKLNEIAQDVYETAAPEDTKLKFASDGMILPYVVVEFGDIEESPLANGIMSTKYNTGQSFIIVSCIAPTQRAARQVAGVVREKLTGFIPEDAGELRLSGSSSVTMIDSKPNRYITELSFAFPVNTIW